MVDLNRARLEPYAHQIIGVEKIVENPFFFLADEMGAGKTKQTIDSAQVLAEMGLIDTVVIVAPAAVRAVWFDPELGELAKHLWAKFPCTITEYHSQSVSWDWFRKFEGQDYKSKLHWFITNYDFIRSSKGAHLSKLLKYCTKKTLLVLDESSAVKNYKAKQTQACEELREECGRILLLNGTPIANNPGDLYSQAHLMDPKILGCKNWFHFRARYATMGGYQGRQIVSWHGIEDLQERMAPYVLRRLKKDCLDLPEKIDSVPIVVTLTPATWKIYREMKEDMVVWLNQNTVASASQALTKVIRLAQITSGFVGGVEREEDLLEQPELPAFIEKTDGQPSLFDVADLPTSNLQEVGREKLDAFFERLESLLEEDPNLKLLVWSRFRPEVARLYKELGEKYAKIDRGLIWGRSKDKNERTHALRLLDPRTAPKGPAVVIGTPATGSMGLNLTAAHTVIYMSNDFSLKTRLQSEDRVHRPGQLYPVSYFDMIAQGPKGQKTIDHATVKALQAKSDLADMTTSAWLDVLLEE
jgi:SNF2 family DNA or RNA helicase